ncbi:hypothetical protein Tco_1420673 [Tanacetum coccineum]
MRTRSSSNLVGNSSSNPTTTNPKRRNRRRSKQPFSLEESPVVTMADQRTMAELLRAPTEGYAEAIVVPPILAEHFELKHSLINMMTSDQFFGLEKDNPHDHIRCSRDEHLLIPDPLPLLDDYDDELFDLETVNDDTYDDPFDFKEEKIKDSKILIDELDPPRSSDFLPFPDYDSTLYEDFSKVDALPSTNNEDKVFNPGILTHENLYEVTNLATMEKNVKKVTNASLILEDFNPPLYELPFR